MYTTSFEHPTKLAIISDQLSDMLYLIFNSDVYLECMYAWTKSENFHWNVGF